MNKTKRNIIYVKVKLWKKIKIKDDTDLKKLASKIEEYGVEAISEEDGFDEQEYICETEETIQPEDNKNIPTIEICQATFKGFDSFVKNIWNNIDKFNA